MCTTKVGPQQVGLAILRFVGRLKPLASASVDDLVSAGDRPFSGTRRAT